MSRATMVGILPPGLSCRWNRGGGHLWGFLSFQSAPLELSTLQSFKNTEVSVGGGALPPSPSAGLQVTLPSPPGAEGDAEPFGAPSDLMQPFCSSKGRGKLRAFLEQFMQL